MQNVYGFCWELGTLLRFGADDSTYAMELNKILKQSEFCPYFENPGRRQA